MKKQFMWNFYSIIGALLLLATSCSIKSKDENPVIIKVGEYYGGGVIIYVDSTGQHGLIASYEILSPGGGGREGSTSWGCQGTLIGGTSTAFGTGQNNTTCIITKCTIQGIAAIQCNDFSSYGYSDWFLPSIDEVKLIYLQDAHFTNKNFIIWSSSEVDSNSAWGYDCTHGYKETYLKTCDLNIRPVRHF